VVLVLLATLTALTSPVRAARPVRVYEVTVRDVDPATVPRQAVRAALVRATGRRDAADDPALARLVEQATRYVQSMRPGAEGTTQVVLDGAALERDIIASGRSTWDAERPFTIVVLNPPLTGAAADGARQSLEEIAEGRGLPVTLVPMALTDATGAPLGNEVLLQDAQRLGGDAVLLGRADPAQPAGTWQWTLLTGFSSDSWNGSFEAGINGAADSLARVEGGSTPQHDAEALVQVSGVSTLVDYAAVDRMLADLPGVRHSGLEESDGASATFRLLIRGGAEAVERALAHSARLTSTGTSNDRLTYQYHP
jgi:hypothetical protein